MSPRPEAEARDRGLARRHDLIGSQLGVYRVLARLGSGGMGEVYEVEHEELGRRFALKVLRADLAQDQETLSRFHREPRAVAKLVSEHVVSIVDCGSLPDGTPYFVMERLYGSDLRRLLGEQGLLPITRVVHLAVDACRGLACAHRQGLVHRDLKPENLFVTSRDDGQDLCKLLDFGVVKSAQDNSTRPGAILGTTRYMAPEQLGLDVDLCPQTDLFALGVIVYECLTGQSPFEGDTVERVLFKIMTERETPIRELRPDVPEGLATLISQAMSKDPAARPASALAFAEALLPYARPVVFGQALSPWALRVTQGDAAASSERDLTPRALEAGVAAAVQAARSAQPGQRRHATGYPLTLLGLVVGLALGAVGGLLVARHATPGVASKAASRAAPTIAVRPAPSEPEARTSASAEARVPEKAAAPAAGIASDSTSAARNGKRKPRLVNAATSPAPPAASFDAHNPYAQ